MLEAYRRYVIFQSKKKDPKSGKVCSIGEDVKGISVGDTIFHFDYAPLCLNKYKGYFAVNIEHVVAVEKASN